MQHKQIVDPNFIIVLLETQKAIQEGYVIDEVNYPFASPMYYEVNLIKDNSAQVRQLSEELQQVEAAPEAKKAGRPPRNK